MLWFILKWWNINTTKGNSVVVVFWRMTLAATSCKGDCNWTRLKRCRWLSLIKSVILPAALSEDQPFLKTLNPFTVGLLESVRKIFFSQTKAGSYLLIKRYSSSKLAFRPRLLAFRPWLFQYNCMVKLYEEQLPDSDLEREAPRRLHVHTIVF